MTEKKNLLEFSPEDLEQELVAMGEKPFRAAQIYPWLTPVSYTHLDVYKRQPVYVPESTTADSGEK